MQDRKTRSLEAALAEAKKQFSTKPYDDVSVNEIATAAQCSTTTIYDVYRNKMGLYIAATQSFIFGVWDDIEKREGGGSPLERLVSHLEARAERYAQPNFREMVRYIISNISTSGFTATPDMRKSLTEHYVKMLENVQACVTDGTFRPLPATIINDGIFASIGWRPLFHGLLLGSNDPVSASPSELAWRSLLPFLSEAGRRNYAALRPELSQTIESIGESV